MNQVTVRVEDLSSILHDNRDQHREQFLEAQHVYRARVIEWLDEQLASARRGEKVRRAISLPEPEDFTDEYDRVIRMLEMSVEDKVTLTAREFDNFVRDKWDWTQRFATNTTSYLADDHARHEF